MKKKVYFKRKKKNRTKKRKRFIYFLFVVFVTFIILFNLKFILFKNIIKSFFTKKLSKIPNKKEIINYKELNKTELIDNYLSSIPSKYNNKKEKERKFLEYFTSLKILSKDDIPVSSELKLKLINELNNEKKYKNFANIKSIFILEPGNFGNRIIMLNNIIFYSEILGIKNIYLRAKYNWYIKNNIISDKINITFMSLSKMDCNRNDILCVSFVSGFLITPFVIKPEIKINILKNEIKRNLPYVEVDPNDLYIHIRSGDIFYKIKHSYQYAQPPLCFYQNILNNFKFKNIYIISVSHNNPVINKLLNEYPNIIYKKHRISKDIAYLSNANNIVGSISSFVISIIKFNDNLKKFWEYDIYKISGKFILLHHDFYDFPRNYIIYRMKPSENYKNEMFVWMANQNQLQLMINEKCIYNFTIIYPNIT